MEKAKENPNSEDKEEFSELIKDYNLKSIKYDTPINGVIVQITEEKVIIDIGHKTEGILNKSELLKWDGSFQHKVGDAINVVCKNVNTREGYITVSKKQLDMKEGWDKVVRCYEKKINILGKITKVVDNNKGFMVDMGVEMFLPMSLVDIKKIKNPQKLLGKEFWFKVTKINPKDKTGVVSRRILLEEEKREKIKKLFSSFKEDDVIKGVVTSVTDYGAFIDIGGIDGLIHKENISYGRITHPREKLRKGDEIETKILEIDRENHKISLGIKQKYPDPWIDIQKKYPLGKRLIAKVTKIVSFGAFIELEEGVEGLLHISDLTWEGKPRTVEEFVAVGDKLWIQIIEVNKEEKKIKLGLKQLEMRPEEKFMGKHKSGDIVSGKVKKILNSKVFVELEIGVEGILKISDISYFRIDSPKEFLKENQEIEVMIISAELDSQYKVKLGIKQLSDSEWHDFFATWKSGNIIPVKIKRFRDRGINVEISKNIEGFVKLSEIDDQRLSLEDIKQKYKIGEKVEALITNTNPERKRVFLSFKGAKLKKEKEVLEKYSKSDNDTITTIGDLLQSEIDKKK